MDRQRDLSEASDALLAARAADGDRRAFEGIVRRYSGQLRAYVHRILGSSLDVDDVVQETFVAAWRTLPRLRDREALKGWLLKMASNRALNRIRDRREHDDLDRLERPDDEDRSPEHRAELSERQAALTRALLELPELNRRVWALRELGDYSYDDIARALGVSVSTVRGSLARARLQLARRMEQWR